MHSREPSACELGVVGLAVPQVRRRGLWRLRLGFWGVVFKGRGVGICKGSLL